MNRTERPFTLGLGAGTGMGSDDSTCPLNDDTVTFTCWSVGTPTYTWPECDAKA